MIDKVLERTMHITYEATTCGNFVAYKKCTITLVKATSSLSSNFEDGLINTLSSSTFKLRVIGSLLVLI